MKKKTSRSLLALLLVCVMAISLAACGKKDNSTGALTKEQYQEAVTNLMKDFSDIQTKVNNGTDIIADKEAAVQLLKELKTPLENFKAIQAPKEYEEGHAKLQSGCQAMIDYLDIVIEAANADDPASKLTENAEAVQEKMLAAVTDMTEGSKLLTEAGLTLS